jgi:preprotein translocase subunit SecG
VPAMVKATASCVIFFIVRSFIMFILYTGFTDVSTKKKPRKMGLKR